MLWGLIHINSARTLYGSVKSSRLNNIRLGGRARYAGELVQPAYPLPERYSY